MQFQVLCSYYYSPVEQFKGTGLLLGMSVFSSGLEILAPDSDEECV